MMFQKDVPLSEHTSYKIGGPARCFFDANTIDGLKSAITESKKKNLKLLIIGGGTNLLAGDRGFDGLALKPNLRFIEQTGNQIHVGAGMLMSELVNRSVACSLSGLEWAGGLPGTVGGAVRGNAGAFGGETKDAISRVRSLDIGTLEEIERDRAECDFGYRSSIFKKQGQKEIILSAVFELKEGDKKRIEDAVNEKIAYRRDRHPLEYPNIGSVFKNVPVEDIPAAQLPLFKGVVKTDPFPVVPAACLIAEAGLKGMSAGGAMVSPKHPNFIVNVLHASAKDVEMLIKLVRREVKKKYQVTLEEEIIRV